MLKKLIISLFLVANASSFASEDPSPKEKRKHQLCLIKSKIVSEFLSQKCESDKSPDICFAKARVEWLEYLEYCLQNSKENERK